MVLVDDAITISIEVLAQRRPELIRLVVSDFRVLVEEAVLGRQRVERRLCGRVLQISRKGLLNDAFKEHRLSCVLRRLIKLLLDEETNYQSIDQSSAPSLANYI